MWRSCLLVAFVLLLMTYSSLGHGKEPKFASLIRCKKHEREALSKFKHSFTKDPMNRLCSWVGEDCCNWRGVSCDNVTNSVIVLNLRYPTTDCSNSDGSLVSSGLSPALLELEFLSHLDLSKNDFSESPIPEFLGSMRHLKYLNLSGAGFSGSLPPHLGNLTKLTLLDLHVNFECIGPAGLFAKSVGWAFGLSKLQYLDLGSCDLSEAHDTPQLLMRLPSLLFFSLSACQPPKSILSEALITENNTSNSCIHTLQHLDLSDNGLDGPFPPILKNMVSLQHIALDFNGFNGSIPFWLRNMRHLQYLKLGINNFSHVEGGMWGIMANPCSFKHLDLSDNAIAQGDFLEPFVNSSGCTAYDLEYLNLSDNQFNGSLPSQLGQLRNLKYLDLSNNEFQGKMPTSLVELSALKYLDLSGNMLRGFIPDFFKHFTEIEHLDISTNSMEGTISGIDNLSMLSYFDVSFNNLKVKLNFKRPAFTLQALRVHSCKINMVFPQWLRNQTLIERLDLSYAGISGELPGWLWNMSNLQELQLSGNQLSGSLPQHVRCDGCKLLVLDLHNNLLSGPIPSWLSHLATINVIDLSRNLLSGAIFEGENVSSLLTGRNSLNVLDLGDNMLFGEIQVRNVDPEAYLEILSLRGNDFSGPIPAQLCNFQSLRILEFAQNRLTGRIPRCLGSVQFDSNNGGLFGNTGLEFEEVVKGTTQVFAGTRGTQSLIDLSSNQLFGSIPEELTNISKLEALNLSNNYLTGFIPRQIGNLKSLGSLDLSNNQLSGTIPQSLSDVPWLSSLNLSNNNLYGSIPSGRQLQTLDDPSIYAGNSDLCGFPLGINCTKTDIPPSSTNVNPGAGEDDGEDDNHETLWLYLVTVLGVGTGFWVVIGTLVVKKSWREAYFRVVEGIFDNVYVEYKVRMNRFRNRL